MQTGIEKDLRSYTAHTLQGSFVGFYSFADQLGWVRVDDDRHATNWKKVPLWQSEIHAIYGETNVRLAMHTGCICHIGNWESLCCPKHGLDAQRKGQPKSISDELREYGVDVKGNNVVFPIVPFVKLTKAADLIEQQQAEIERKTELLENERRVGYSLLKKSQDQQAEIDRLGIVISKLVGVINEVDKSVYANFDIPTKIREKIQYIISPYSTVDHSKGAAANDPDNAL